MKKQYVVTGPVPRIGYTNEFVSASSIKQALRFVALRLKEKHGLTTVYLGDCIVTERS